MLFERTRKARKNVMQSKSNMLDYNAHSLRATLLSMLKTTLKSPQMSIEIEFDKLDEAIEVINTKSLQESYNIVQTETDANVFKFSLKEKDYVL